MSTKIDSLTNVHIFLLPNPFACLCSTDDAYVDVSTLRLSAFESCLVVRCAMCFFLRAQENVNLNHLGRSMNGRQKL